MSLHEDGVELVYEQDDTFGDMCQHIGDGHTVSHLGPRLQHPVPTAPQQSPPPSCNDAPSQAPNPDGGDVSTDETAVNETGEPRRSRRLAAQWFDSL